MPLSLILFAAPGSLSLSVDRATDHLPSLLHHLSVTLRSSSSHEDSKSHADEGIADATSKKAIADVLKNGSENLTVEKRITILADCLKMGILQAKRAEGKDLLIVIGNTGAGKSTFVNCECLSSTSSSSSSSSSYLSSCLSSSPCFSSPSYLRSCWCMHS